MSVRHHTDEGARIIETVPDLPAPSEGQDLVADYGRLGLTLGRHPLALLRNQLAALRLKSARQLWVAKS